MTTIFKPEAEAGPLPLQTLALLRRATAGRKPLEQVTQCLEAAAPSQEG